MTNEIVQQDDREWSTSIAELIADALLDAKLIEADELRTAIEIAAEEIFVRLALNDRPRGKSAASS